MGLQVDDVVLIQNPGESFVITATQSEIVTLVFEMRRHKIFGNNVGHLATGRNITNTNITCSNVFTDKMIINVDLLGAVVLNRIGRKIRGSNVVVTSNNGQRKAEAEFKSKMFDPTRLNNCISRQQKDMFLYD